MQIIISNNADKPIYEQITSQFKAMIMSGELHAGDTIPSVRALAKSIHVSVITVRKAYEELHREGFIETAVGRDRENQSDFSRDFKRVANDFLYGGRVKWRVF